MEKSISKTLTFPFKQKQNNKRHSPRAINWIQRKRREYVSSDAGRTSDATVATEDELSDRNILTKGYSTPLCLKILMKTLETESPVAPDKFLRIIMKCRGLNCDLTIPVSANKCKPTDKQIKDYDLDTIDAVKENKLEKLLELQTQGKSMSACNKFCESILHVACKRSNFETVQFLLSHGADLSITDDYGRTPLHDACWRPEPDFGIVSLLLTLQPSLIVQCDKWGFTPLMYIGKSHWTPWCSFLYYHQHVLFPILLAQTSATRVSTSNTVSVSEPFNDNSVPGSLPALGMIEHESGNELDSKVTSSRNSVSNAGDSISNSLKSTCSTQGSTSNDRCIAGKDT